MVTSIVQYVKTTSLVICFLYCTFPPLLTIVPSLVLLFVLWYCYKRGREERLQTETNRLVPKEEADQPQDESGKESGKKSPEQPEPEKEADEGRPPTSTLGAVEEAKQEESQQQNGSSNGSAPPLTAGHRRSKSRLSWWSRSQRKPSITNVEPYPGT